MIIRVKKNKNYTTINNTALHDRNLSWKAKGLFAYMMTNKDDWKFYVSEIERHSTDGIKATRSGINELIEAGYLKKEIVRDRGTITEHLYTLYEEPLAYKGQVDKGTLINTNSNKMGTEHSTLT